MPHRLSNLSAGFGNEDPGAVIFSVPISKTIKYHLKSEIHAGVTFAVEHPGCRVVDMASQQ